MPNPDDHTWQDIQKLDDLYEELLWDPDDELQFKSSNISKEKEE